MSKENFKDHFSKGSDNYAAYRPTYPMRLVDELVKVCPATNMALDCGCGTGQLSTLLAERFKNVVATDASAAQIGQAEKRDNIVYKTALAEESGLPGSSVDLITVAQAAHWLDMEKFNKEVQRVGTSEAIVALITYGALLIDGKPDKIVQHFHYETLGQYWPPERRHVEDGYKNLAFPFKEIKMPDLAIEVSWNLNDLVGYFNTWSAVRVAEKALGLNPVPQVEKELRATWGDPNLRRKVTWPLSFRVGRLA